MPASHRQPSLAGRQPELAALDQIVRTIRQGGRLAVIEGDTARWRERVDEHPRVWDLRPDVAQERQSRVAETILELLDDLCTRSPVLLAIEDLHEIDGRRGAPGGKRFQIMLDAARATLVTFAPAGRGLAGLR